MTAVMDSSGMAAGAGFGDVFRVFTHGNTPQVAIVCEHASNRIPENLNRLGLSEEVAQSHVAWDPGALGVAQAMAKRMQSVLVSGAISRLVFDCNRPPEAESAIPAKSEMFDIPGNQNLTAAQRQARIRAVSDVFAAGLAAEISKYRTSLEAMVTIHSFTPVFFGAPRSVEIGILHGQDARLARAMIDTAPEGCPYDIRLNEPYAAEDGVTHTLDEHGTKNGLANVMIEIRNDLIETPDVQQDMAELLAGWTSAAHDQVRAAQ